MKKVLVFRHVSHEGLGTIELVLKALRVQIDYCDLYRSSPIPENPANYDFVISVGGPMNVDETARYPFLQSERAFITKAIYAGKPILGICLGAQIIARALGARVYPGPQKEIGWYPIQFSRAAQRDPVFGSISGERPTVFHWHGDTFDLPNGATLLASSTLFPHQAFQFKDSVYALQFHIEVTSEMICDWAQKNEAELNQLGSSFSKEEIISGIPKYERPLQELAHKIYESLFSKLALVGTTS